MNFFSSGVLETASCGLKEFARFGNEGLADLRNRPNHWKLNVSNFKSADLSLKSASNLGSGPLPSLNLGKGPFPL